MTEFTPRPGRTGPGTAAALLLPLCCLVAAPATAQAPRHLPSIPVETAPPPAAAAAPPAGAIDDPAPASPTAPAALAAPAGPLVPLGGGTVAGPALQTLRPGAGGDAAALLRGLPGVGLYAAGGTSSLPAINGLAGDRIRQTIDGMPVTAACPNHMNPPLSTVDPARIAAIEVMAGIAPVRSGGDSIAGTITAESAPPVFANQPGTVKTSGSVSSFYRSNNNGFGVSGNGTVASDSLSLGYAGAWNRGGHVHAGGGDPIRSTGFETTDHALTVAVRRDDQMLVVQGGMQFVPYQGFPNQRMDLTDNRTAFLNGRWQGRFDWGRLDARAFWQHVTHEMNFLDDKGGSDNGGMPMKTGSTTAGTAINAELNLSPRDTIRIGNEVNLVRLDDWWPAVAGSRMMGPLTYVNINDGRRNRVGTYVEWEARQTPQWTTLVGARNDVVWMNAGPVRPYSWQNPIPAGMMAMANPDAPAAAAFNARDRAKTDINIDLTALARFTPDAGKTFEAGIARKTRSPNLYERYSWGTGSMSSSMVGWFGDANGYVGNPDIKPETAYTAGLGAAWHDLNGGESWEIKFTPYASVVRNFIDADPIANLANGFVQLRFANHDALLLGVNVSGHVDVADDPAWGKVRIAGNAGWVKGRNLDTGDGLYHIMPISGRLAVEHRLNAWSNAVEFQFAGAKTSVAADRREPTTSSYGLVNLRTGWRWDNVRVEAGIDNLLDTRYALPLGGVDYADFRATGSTPPVGALPGPGRSFNIGMTVTF
jgi:iron complex outermembrane receptor protein